MFPFKTMSSKAMTVQPLWSRASIIAPARSNNLRISAWKTSSFIGTAGLTNHLDSKKWCLATLPIYHLFINIYHIVRYFTPQTTQKVWMIGGILKLGGLKSCHRKAATKTIPRPVNDVQHDEGQSSAYHPWHSHRPGFNIAGLEKNSEAISKQSKNWINLASSVLSKKLHLSSKFVWFKIKSGLLSSWHTAVLGI